MPTDYPHEAAAQPSDHGVFAQAHEGAAAMLYRDAYIAGPQPAPVNKFAALYGDDLSGRIVQAIGHNEGSLTNINRNDNGHGISIGVRQWNQRCGEMPSLLKAMHDQNPEKFDRTFGKYSHNLLKESWVRQADMAGNHDLMRRMRNALHDPEFQQVQIDKAREFADRSVETARRYGIKTEHGAALIADIINQLGEGGARRILALAHLRPGRTISNEKATLHRIERLTYRPNSRDRFNTIATRFSDGALISQPTRGDDSPYLA
ncbi:MAG: hypothetical protein JSS86_08070 [Cyanobacteria bacterium SZAS LIN-2]|nr:hypothetical protein [Cyanobacteria bacterium SZAS LIN-2]